MFFTPKSRTLNQIHDLANKIDDYRKTVCDDVYFGSNRQKMQYASIGLSALAELLVLSSHTRPYGTFIVSSALDSSTYSARIYNPKLLLD